MRRYFYSILLLLIVIKLPAQFGGNATYDFLNLTTSARVNAMGGTQVGIIDSAELSFIYYNPSLLMPDMHNSLTLNYIDYIADIRIGYTAYARHFENIGTFAAGMHYINYGQFIRALESGEKIGNFTAADYALNLTYSRDVWENIRVGASLKPVYSVYEVYSSFGIASDIGVSYADSSGNFNAGIVAKNMGLQLTNYDNEIGHREPLPFDLQAGFSQRLAHAPFRFSVTLHSLTKWKLTDKRTWDYDHRENDFVVGQSDDVLKQFMRHVILGVEFIPTKNFLIGMGYNFQRRWELSLHNNPAAVGLSGGFTVNVSKFRVSYAIASYHVGGASNIFSITTNLSEFAR
jgi:hypothetical protein